MTHDKYYFSKLLIQYYKDFEPEKYKALLTDDTDGEGALTIFNNKVERAYQGYLSQIEYDTQQAYDLAYSWLFNIEL